MKKKETISAKMRLALDTIGYGDDVRFVNCFEAQVYGERTFKVMSEAPIISKTKYGTSILVRLQHLGLFPIEKLKLVQSNVFTNDEKAKKGLHCCIDSNCPECEYAKYGPLCIPELHKDLQAYAKRIESYRAVKEGGKK
ncbi:MAG: hypothetical protein IJC07_00385 [Clostridia bacterium]|nr:hypothetical protein [Clostridia bacterium]